ncbi:hypothetical protein TNCV_781211 [Trichonephila clavipes]|nr:hypothetical protein TNCV_781211 [Trichonephila clavipes]
MWMCQGNKTADELAAKSPVLSLQCRCSRVHQTALARFRSGHMRGMNFVKGVKSLLASALFLLLMLIFFIIPLRQFFEDQGLVCDIIIRKGQMNLV